jgi:hypothetical protein
LELPNVPESVAAGGIEYKLICPDGSHWVVDTRFGHQDVRAVDSDYQADTTVMFSSYEVMTKVLLRKLTPFPDLINLLKDRAVWWDGAFNKVAIVGRAVRAFFP